MSRAQITAPNADAMLTDQQRGEYLDALADPGVKPNEAAERIGTTGTKMRALRKRDPEWDAVCIEAEAERALAHAEDLVAEARERMTTSDRILEVELATHVPKYAHLRRDKTKHEHVHTGLTITLDAGALDAMTLDEKRELRATLARLGGRVEEPRRLIESGTSGTDGATV